MPETQWIVVGAGPAGISTVGTLLDEGVDPKAVVWVDPAFQVGDFGAVWSNVPSNTRVGDFYGMFESCRSFEFNGQRASFGIDELAKESWCDLRYVAEPLRAITATLRRKVRSVLGFVTRCESAHDGWLLRLRDGEDLRARNAVLCVGARPRMLAHPNLTPIPLEVALDRERMPSACSRDDTVAVFGSSHSAVLAMQILLEHCDVAGVVNFYRSPLRYAVKLDDGGWLYYDTGLKGTTAQWARANLASDRLPEKLVRCVATGDAEPALLARCTKAIYAVGFEPRPEPLVDGMAPAEYDTHAGIIAPGLFGCGFAFPEIAPDEFGNPVPRVGLLRFARYLARVIPLWKSYPAT